jgi:hypothetical protein
MHLLCAAASLRLCVEWFENILTQRRGGAKKIMLKTFTKKKKK